MDPMFPVPYSLGAVEAFCSYWNVPYNYVPRYAAIRTCSATFSPIIGDEAWKGTFDSMLLWPEEHDVVQKEPKRPNYRS